LSPKEETARPRLPSGFSDSPPTETAARDWVLDTVCQVYRSYGFVPLDTSPVEYFQTIVSGHDDIASKQIYRLFKDKLPEPNKALALRFELTGSLVRFVTQNIDRFPLPFKRYQVGYVWRGERPQRGRFRQFLQFDVDTVGIADPVADTEILEVVYRSLEALKLPAFEIRLSSRNLLSGLAAVLGLTTEEERLRFFRILDKYDKIGACSVLQLLEQPPAAHEEGMGFSHSQLSTVEKVLAMKGANESLLEQMEEVARGPAETAAGLRELRSVLRYWNEARLPRPDFLRVIPHLARGLDYYTGPVFETFLPSDENLGSIMAGGRYDGLVGRYVGRDIPAVGVSMGIDRLIVALENLSLMPETLSACRVLVAVLSEEERETMYGVASQLRQHGITTELYLGNKLTFREQIKYAAAQGIPWLLIQGENERHKGVVALRDLAAREQIELSLDQAVLRLKEL
jgi:histidyl-tRNA synthetase